MARSAPADPYVYPGTDVLKNHLDLRTQHQLERAERPLTAARLQDLEREPVKGKFDISHYADTHHAIFKDVYPFAGEFRTVDISKWSEHRGDYTTFLPAQVIVPWLNRHLNEEVAKRDNFRHLGRDEFVDRATRLYLDLNAFHAFREGNGRTQREFIRTLGLNAGYEIDWRRLDKDQLLEATLRTAFDATKKDRSLHEQLARAIVNPTQDLALQRAWDRYVSGGGEFGPPRGGPSAEWRGTLQDAIRASDRSAPGPSAFVSAEWETESRIRVYSARALLEALDKIKTEGTLPAVYGVREDGTVHNTVTGRDEYLRLDAKRADYPARLQKAADRHFERDPGSPTQFGGPDIEGP